MTLDYRTSEDRVRRKYGLIRKLHQLRGNSLTQKNYHEDFGKKTLNVLPDPSVLSTPIEPPHDSMIR